MKATCDARWIADLEARKQTEVLLKFTNGYYHGQDAVTCNNYGKGKAYYQGIANLGAELLSKMAEMVIDAAKIEHFKSPAGVEVIDCGDAVFVLNSNNKTIRFKLPVKGRALCGSFDQKTSRVEIDPVDACILKKE